LPAIYLDMETYRRGGKAFVREEIIAIGVLEEGSSEPKIFKVWNGGRMRGEAEVLKEFYEYIMGLGDPRNIIFVGFNILRFDIPLLIQRLARHKVAEKMKRLPQLNHFWNSEVLVVDLMQLTLPLNKMKFKSHTLENIASMLRRICPEIPEPKGRGSEIPRAYKEGNYAYIEEHLKTDLIIIKEVYSCIRKWVYPCVRKCMNITLQGASTTGNCSN